MTVYVGFDTKIHTKNPAGVFRAVETDFFEGTECKTFIEGHSYDDCKGYLCIYPWKPYNELAAAQDQYERDMAEAAAAYQEGVNSAYDQ